MAGLGLMSALVVLVLRAPHAIAHLNIRRQHRPYNRTGGDSYDQKPPDHPHDDLGYQNASVLIRLYKWGFSRGGASRALSSIFTFSVSYLSERNRKTRLMLSRTNRFTPRMDFAINLSMNQMRIRPKIPAAMSKELAIYKSLSGCSLSARYYPRSAARTL